ncbi:MAG: hypothetical protein JKP98_00145 [Rhodobacteraceae bacterium]|nr:hypothetical protein [Paracoccaceae bacterium]
MPGLAGNQQQSAAASDAGVAVPGPRAKAATNPALMGQKGIAPRAGAGGGWAFVAGGIVIGQPVPEPRRLRCDLAREEMGLVAQKPQMVVEEYGRKAVIGEQAEGRAFGIALRRRNQMCDKALEKGLVRDPAAAEETDQLGVVGHMGQDVQHGLAAQAPPLRPDHDAQPAGNGRRKPNVC